MVPLAFFEVHLEADSSIFYKDEFLF